MSVNTVRRLCELLRSFSPDFTLGQLQTLLEIVVHDDIPSQTEIAERTGLPLVTVSRHCANFGPVRKQYPKALDFLRMVQAGGDDDRRQTVMTLTPKGKLVATQIRSLLKD